MHRTHFAALSTGLFSLLFCSTSFADSGLITTIAGTGIPGTGGTGGPAAGAKLNMPYGIALDSAGNLFVADSGNYRVVRIDAATRDMGGQPTDHGGVEFELHADRSECQAH